MNCIIVDDDPNCIKALNGLIQEYLPNVKVMGTAKNLKEAVQLINSHEPDAVFLDVEIQDESGFDLFKFIPSPEFEVIFTTAHEKYALKAIKSSCFDFLLKPIDIEELMNTMSRLNSRLKSNHQIKERASVLLKNVDEQSKKVSRIAIPTSDEMVFVETDRIMYLEGDAKYTKIHTVDDKDFLSSKNIGEFEEFLDDEVFFRCHRSWIVNLNFINKFHKSDSQIELNNGHLIDVSTRKKEAFMKLFNRV